MLSGVIDQRCRPWFYFLEHLLGDESVIRSVFMKGEGWGSTRGQVRVIVPYEMNIPELFQFSRSRVLKSLFIIHPIVYFFQGLIYRFEFLMVVTVLCAGLTVVFFIITNVNEAQWKFGEEESTVEISSEKHVFMTGGDSPYERGGILVVSLRGIILGRTPSYLAVKASFRVAREKI